MNNSKTLLIFQAPGTEEWKKGEAIQNVKKTGGTAGARIAQSWARINKNRSDFDVINAVRCFPGKVGERDIEPNVMSICSCSSKLENDLKNNDYNKIITFGKVAEQVVDSLIQRIDKKPEIINVKHPTGGIKKDELDSLW